MKSTRSLVIVLGLLILAGAAHAQTTAIIGGTLIDGTGAQPRRDVVILIGEKKISAVGAKEAVKIPFNAKIIDATGKYIIPGLMDANVHLILNATPAWLGKYDGRFEDVAAEAAQVELKNGVTTVFDSWGPLQPLLNVRDRIRRGDLVASRLYVAGNIVGLSGPLGRDFKSETEMATLPPAFAERMNKIWEENVGPSLLDLTPEEIRIEIRKYIARGIDFIKFAEASHRTLTDSWLMFSPEGARAIVEEGHAAGLAVQSHTMNPESLRLAVLSGIDLAQHPDVTGSHDLPESLIRIIVEKEVYCAVIAEKRERIQTEKEVWRASGGRLWMRSPEFTDRWQGNIEKLIRARARIVMATDARLLDPEFNPYPPEVQKYIPRLFEHFPTQMGEANFLWLEAIVEKGMAPMDAIVAATRNVAAAYHHLSEFGTLEPGKYADVLMLDADPLENISNVRKISLVMKEGRVIDRERLPERRVIPEW